MLRVRCNVEKIRKLQEREGIVLKAGMKWRDQDFESDLAVLVEAVVAPNSVLEGKTCKSVKFRNTFGAIVLAIRHSGTVRRENVGRTCLRASDALLVEVRRNRLEQLKQHQAFVVVSEIDFPSFRKK